MSASHINVHTKSFEISSFRDITVREFRTDKFKKSSWLYTLFVIAAFWWNTTILTAQTDSNVFIEPDYRNVIYDPNPAPVPSANITQTASVALFSGHVSYQTMAPNDGRYYLWRSVIGQPIGGIPARIIGRTFKFGEEIIPEDSLFVNATRAPALINPPEAARFVNGLNKVVAASPGFVEISWHRSDGSVNSPVTYYIDPTPVRDPVALYHTHSSGTDLGVASQKETTAPVVTLPSAIQATFFHNSAIPTNSTANTINSYIFVTSAKNVYAKAKTGLILLEYRDASGNFKSLEIVEVRSNSPDSYSASDIGYALQPNRSYLSNSVIPFVAKGLDLANPATGPSGFAYQHLSTNSPQNGQVFAVKRTTTSSDIEIYWRRSGLEGVEWPYELHQYSADWPKDSNRYQRYVRGSTSIKGPNVVFPQTLAVNLMPFQQPSSHALEVSANSFQTIGEGWSLLKYLSGDNFGFQVIRSVLHNDTQQFDLSLKPWDIGREILEESHAGPRPGYIHQPEGDRYDWETYEGIDDNPTGWKSEWTTKQIFGIKVVDPEIWTTS